MNMTALFRTYARLLLVVILLGMAVDSRAIVAGSMEFDYNGARQVSEGFGENVAKESLNNSYLKEIFKHFTEAEVAAVSIFNFRLAERNSKKGIPGVFSSAESYYYRHIWYLIERRIIPLTLSIVKVCSKYPERAMYWGPYMFTRLSDVKELCKEFSSIVTNGKLGFDGIRWIEFVPELQQVFSMLSEGEELKKAIENFGSLISHVYKEELWDDVRNLFNIAAVDPKEIGKRNGRKIYNILDKRVSNVRNMILNFDDYYEDFQSTKFLKNLVNGVIGDLKDSLGWTKLVRYSDGFDIEGYLTDYLRDYSRKYYTIRCIVTATGASGREFYVLADELYDSRLWTMESFKNDLMNRAYELAAEKSIEKSKQMMPGEEYVFTNFTFKEIQESYHEYEEPDDEYIGGCSAAKIYLKCDDGKKVTNGSFNFKINKHLYQTSIDYNAARQKGVYGGDHSIVYDNEGEVNPKVPDTADGEKYISDHRVQITQLEQEIRIIEYRKESLYIELDQVEEEEAKQQLRQQISALDDEEARYERQIDLLNAEINEMQKIMDDAQAEYDDDMDGDYRIVNVEAELQRAYHLQWLEKGKWEGTRYTRTCQIPDLENIKIKFIAEVSIERPESRNWLIGRYHRMIVAVNWKLCTEQESDDMVDLVSWDDNTSDADRRRMVDMALNDVRNAHPGCSAYAVYETKPTVTKENEGEEPFHLLWPADRLAFARYVDKKIEHISYQLILFEKWLYEEDNIVGLFKKSFSGRLYTPTQFDGPARSALNDWINNFQDEFVSFRSAAGARRKEVAP